MDSTIDDLVRFLETNPPDSEDWYPNDWEIELDKIPNYKKLLNNISTWDAIRNIQPRHNYVDLLYALLKFAPDEVLANYLEGSQEERNAAIKSVYEDDFRITPNLWKSLKPKGKAIIFAHILSSFQYNHSKYHTALDKILQSPELYDKSKIKEILKNEFPNVPYFISNPLWILLKLVIFGANDPEFKELIEELERPFSIVTTKNSPNITIEQIRGNVNFNSSLSDNIVTASKHFDNNVSRNVMLDPSIVLDEFQLEKAITFIDNNSHIYNFYVPSSLIEYIKRTDNNERDYAFITQFYGKRDINLGNTSNIMSNYPNINKFEAPVIFKEKHLEFYNNLREHIRKQEITSISFPLADIIFEEWVFLQEYSWVIAMYKKVFNFFSEAGGLVIEGSQKILDNAVSRTLKKENHDVITHAHRLRSLGKWIAVSGPPLISSQYDFEKSVIGVLIGVSTGVFLLFDPE